MHSVTLEEAKEHLAELVAEARKGEEIVITEGKEPVARLSPASPRWRAFGLLKGKITFHDGWEETPEEFRPYLE